MGFWDSFKKAVAIGGLTLLLGGAAFVAYFAAWIVALFSLITAGQWLLFGWLLAGSYLVWAAGRHFIHARVPPGPLSFILAGALKVLVDLPALLYFWNLNRPLLTALLALGTLLALGIEAAREAINALSKKWTQPFVMQFNIPLQSTSIMDHGDHVHVGDHIHYKNSPFGRVGGTAKQVLTPPPEFASELATQAKTNAKNANAKTAGLQAEKPGVKMPGQEKLAGVDDAVTFLDRSAAERKPKKR